MEVSFADIVKESLPTNMEIDLTNKLTDKITTASSMLVLFVHTRHAMMQASPPEVATSKFYLQVAL